MGKKPLAQLTAPNIFFAGKYPKKRCQDKNLAAFFLGKKSCDLNYIFLQISKTNWLNISAEHIGLINLAIQRSVYKKCKLRIL
ncbi:hypothetical protein [Iodobacter fluviatilis]|uniref:Uncharacterized protein n=1 Tax=Iodobacter fluviatilis TaxID=537 RepID=A0A377Q7P1_9NEIS|nr:hypothetical protein [Iodobacter fluviatilis]TCU82653.1 hypothetical protein EV682_11425 [Iodobacter fluviatilis]STQ89861.1 Uncharacterised protein [Iodobacter fluviatilis]